MELYIRKFLYSCWQFLRWVSKPLCFHLLLGFFCLSPFNGSRVKKKLRRIPQNWLATLSELINWLCYFLEIVAKWDCKENSFSVQLFKGWMLWCVIILREMKYRLHFGIKRLKLREIYRTWTQALASRFLIRKKKKKRMNIKWFKRLWKDFTFRYLKYRMKM